MGIISDVSDAIVDVAELSLDAAAERARFILLVVVLAIAIIGLIILFATDPLIGLGAMALLLGFAYLLLQDDSDLI